MKAIRIGLVMAAVAGASSVHAKDAGPPDGGGSGGVCTTWYGESRQTGYGFRHVVVIKNGCKKAVACTVSTDVAPDPISVTVAAGATEEVVTFLEAVGATFTPKVSCKQLP